MKGIIIVIDTEAPENLVQELQGFLKPENYAICEVCSYDIHSSASCIPHALWNWHFLGACIGTRFSTAEKKWFKKGGEKCRVKQQEDLMGLEQSLSKVLGQLKSKFLLYEAIKLGSPEKEDLESFLDAHKA